MSLNQVWECAGKLRIVSARTWKEEGGRQMEMVCGIFLASS